MLRAIKGLAAMAAIWLLLGTAAQPQAVRRLILSDGTYQMATEWQKVGDRVKYFSAERGEWEEIPLSLIDWKATEEWNAERSKKDTEELKQVTAEQVAARKEEMLNTPLVAPDLRLPAEGGIFLLEETTGKPLLHKVEGTKIQVDDNLGKNMLKRSINPVSSQTQTIELKGAAAKLRVHTPAPSIFVDIDNEQGVIPAENFRIVRLDRKRDTRVVAKNKIAITGEQNTSERYLHSRVEKFSGDWWKVIPLEDLAPGEYAIVVSHGAEDASVVWDFGIDK
jgi:hypothetical protein